MKLLEKYGVKYSKLSVVLFVSLEEIARKTQKNKLRASRRTGEKAKIEKEL